MAIFRAIVSAVDPAVTFYVDKLGFVLERQFGPAMAILRRDDQTLWLAGPTASASRPTPDGGVPAPGGWNRMVLTTGDIEGLATALRAEGVVFRNAIVSGPGGRQVLIEDPSGNPIEVFEPVKGDGP